MERLLSDERDFIANAANFCSLIYYTLPDLNWAGWYIYKDGELVLGPFQGKPACVRIALGKGVCGSAAKAKKTIVVENVHEFPGHIACDPRSKSEIVIPILKENELIGVLDLDSPIQNRFDSDDQFGLETLVKCFVDLTDCK
ncbi:MAG: GAF domain-containing protein [Desulfobacterales bacterium]|nr:MAG: GAF domain-containing protein [Desulfobacterales bacterium]